MENELPRNTFLTGCVDWYNPGRQFGVLIVDGTEHTLGFHKNSQYGAKIRDGKVAFSGFGSTTAIERGTHITFLYGGTGRARPKVNQWALTEDFERTKMVLDAINSRTEPRFVELLKDRRTTIMECQNPKFRLQEFNRLRKTSLTLASGRLKDLERKIVDMRIPTESSDTYDRHFEVLRMGEWEDCPNPIQNKGRYTLPLLTLDEAVTLLSMLTRLESSGRWPDMQSNVMWRNNKDILASGVTHSTGGCEIRIFASDWHAETVFKDEEAHSIIHVGAKKELSGLGQMLKEEMDRQKNPDGHNQAHLRHIVDSTQPL